jgi:hypothetical protein
MIRLALPFPPSVNHANRIGRNRATGRPRVFESVAKRAFVREADGMFLQQKRDLASQRIAGPFTYHLVLNEALRSSNADGDNRAKYALDFAQRVGLIEDDKLAIGGSWRWAECSYPALLELEAWLAPRTIAKSSSP